MSRLGLQTAHYFFQVFIKKEISQLREGYCPEK